MSSPRPLSARPPRRLLWTAVSKHGVLLVFTAVALVPIYFMVVNAFKTRSEYLTNPFGPPHDWVTSVFEQAFGANDLFLWLANSTLMTVASVSLATAVAAVAAYPLSLMRWRFAKAFIGLMIVLMSIPPIVLVVPLFKISVDVGLQNTYMGPILIYTGILVPFSTFLLVAFFRTIPRSLLEAAEIDGAGHLRKLFLIVLPLSIPGLVTAAVVQALWVWNEVLIAVVFLQSSGLRTLMVGVTVYQSRYRADVPLTMAGMLWATVPMIGLYLFGQRFFVRGLTAGAVKE